MFFQSVRYQVSFWNGPELLQGDLVIPPGPGPHPAVLLFGGVQGPRDRGRWINLLAQSGLAVLSWDSPGWGGSTGGRGWQPPGERTMELLAAVDFLRDVRDVQGDRLGVISSDLGCWAAALAAGLSSRVGALIMLTPPCTGAMEHELIRIEHRMRGLGFIAAEVGLAQLVLHERIRRLLAGYHPEGIWAAEAPCRAAPWYGWLPGGTPTEIAAFGGMAGYDPRALLSPVHCPVLAVLGADDTASPQGSADRLATALSWSGTPDQRVIVVPRTDDALRPVWAVDPNRPRPPGDWHPELIGVLVEWLAPRIGRLSPTDAAAR